MNKNLANLVLETHRENRIDHFPADIKHLLSRTLLGFFSCEQKLFYNKTRTQVIDKLLRYEIFLPNKPLKDYDSIQSGNPDQKISWGKSWVHDNNHDLVINEKRKTSLKNWIAGVLFEENALSVGPNMLLFWSDFFGIEARRIPFAPKLYSHFNIIRNNALGNYSELLTNILTDPALIFYFKRIMPKNSKIFEFTSEQLFNNYLGGPGFSSTVSNEKKKRIIRLLSKWNLICDSASIYYSNIRAKDIYDETNQLYLEAYFDRQDAREVMEELRYLIFLLMKRPVVSQHLTRHLFRYFLSPEISDDDERKIIEPVADHFLGVNYDITKWLSFFFRQDYFYDERFRFNAVKKPIQFLVKLLKQLDISPVKSSDIDKYAFWDWIRHKSENLGQDLCDPRDENSLITVIGSANTTLTQRILHDRYLLIQGLFESGFVFKQKTLTVTPFDIVRHFSDPANASELVKDLVHFLYAIEIQAKHQIVLVNNYLQTAEDNRISWCDLWIAATESNDAVAVSEINRRLLSLFRYLLIQPEYNYC